MIAGKVRTIARRIIFSNPITTRLAAPLLRRGRTEDDQYRRWITRNSPTLVQIDNMRLKSEQLAYKPVISVIVPVYNPPLSSLAKAIDSVIAQAYPYWELCIADDNSTIPDVRLTLERYARQDKRIKVVFREENGHISKASNSALENAMGEFIALLDHDDVLTADALYEVALALNAEPTIDTLYTNEDKLDFAGARCQPTFKPKWGPDYFLSFMYSAHLAVHRRSLVEAVGGFRVGYEGAQDYDLALRLTELTSNIAHIPKILYNWRMHPDSVAVNIQAKPYAFESANKALNDALARRGETSARAEKTDILGISRIRVAITDPASLAILAFGDLDRNSPEVAKDCKAFGWGSIISSDSKETRRAFWKRAISDCDSNYFILLDDNILGVTPGWLTELLGQISRPGIAAVGPKILSKEYGTHLGAGYSILPGAITANFYGCNLDSFGYGARLVSMHNVSVLSASCLAVKREAFVGALDGDIEYSNPVCESVDLSLALARSRGRLLWDTHARVYGRQDKFESRIDLAQYPQDQILLEQRYKISLFEDPYYPLGLERNMGKFHLDLGT